MSDSRDALHGTEGSVEITEAGLAAMKAQVQIAALERHEAALREAVRKVKEEQAKQSGARTFERLQVLHREWAFRNFGEQMDGTMSLLGVQEELGELSHAHLKGAQGIRHTPQEISAMKRDAVGDIVIYLSDYCTREGIDFGAAVFDTLEAVLQRNWKADPMGDSLG